MNEHGVSEAVKNALDKADELRKMFRDSLQLLKNDASDTKNKLTAYKSRVSSAVELIDGRTVSRAKTLLKVDNEFLRRTLPPNSEAIDDEF